MGWGGAHLHYTIQYDLALYAVFLGERAFLRGGRAWAWKRAETTDEAGGGVVLPAAERYVGVGWINVDKYYRKHLNFGTQSLTYR